MMRARKTRLAMLGAAMATALALAAGIAAAAGNASLIPTANVLTSAGFDEETGYYNPPGINGRIPNGWNVIREAGNPTFYSSCEEKGDCGDPNGAEKLSGTSSQFIVSENVEPTGKPFTVDLYQIAPVESGKAYAVSGFMVSFCGGTANPSAYPCPEGYYIGKAIGLDPSGGTDPNAPSVVWTPEDRRDAKEAGWVRLTNVLNATGPNMTVFLRMNWPFTFHGALGWMDEFRLAPAPTATMGALAPLQSSTSFSVSAFGWRDTSFRATGTYLLYWDLEARDLAGGGWQRFVTDTLFIVGGKDNRGITTTFTGQFGHRYALRAIPTVHQLPDCISYCDWPEQVYLGFPSEPVTVTVGTYSQVYPLYLPLIKR